MEDLVFEYMEGLLRLQKTRLKCINLGYTADKSRTIRCEIDLIEKSLDMLKNLKKK